MDTIYALSSGPGRAGVAVVRISGPGALAAACRLLGGNPGPARRAALRRLRHPRTGVELDRAIVVVFAAPHSFTGEDVVELHLHGGRAVVRAVFDALATCDGVRPAEPGEFSRRAFENGKLDLTAAEAIVDLVNADTEAQRLQALRQLGGELGNLYERWRGTLMQSLARIEAHIDFPDEELPADLVAQSRCSATKVLAEISRHLDDNRRGERLRDGVSVAILGPPNVGKSSLINMLAKREAAIVSAQAGTTRDIIEVHLDLGGYPVIVADTAGLHEAKDEIEGEGVRRALMRAADADIKILMFEVEKFPNLDKMMTGLLDANTLIAVNKVDAWPVEPAAFFRERPVFAISARTGAGVDRLVDALKKAVGERAGLRQDPALTRARHRYGLEECRKALAGALNAEAVELLAEDLRLAVRAIGRITGRVDIEELLDIVFREFCIGK